MAKSLVELETAVADNPGTPEFVDLAHELSKAGRAERAISVCLAGLTRDPSNLQGRLLLARIYFEQGYVPFAAREVQELVKLHPGSNALQHLAAKLDPSYVDLEARSETESDEQVVAEADFEFDILDELDDE